MRLGISVGLLITAVLGLEACSGRSDNMCDNCGISGSGGSTSGGATSGGGKIATDGGRLTTNGGEIATDGGWTGINGGAPSGGSTSGGAPSGGSTTGGVSTGGVNSGGSLGTCKAASGAYRIPWTYVPGQLGAGGATGAGDGNSAGSAGDSGENGGSGGEASSKSGCTHDPNLPQPNAECRGLARTKVSATSVELVFDDGSGLRSTDELGIAAFVDGERVWVSYTDKFEFDCPFCGGRDRQSIEVRAGAAGQLLTFGLSGGIAQSPSSQIVNEIFGAALASTATCQRNFMFDCSNISRTQLDYTLSTTPAQVIPHGVVTSITSATGAHFQVLLARSLDTVTPVPNCADGRRPVADSSFVATRLR